MIMKSYRNIDPQVELHLFLAQDGDDIFGFWQLVNFELNYLQ